MKNRRVVVTGIGVLSSVGKDKEEHIKSLYNGQTGMKSIHRFDMSHPFYRNTSACVIDNEVLEKILEDDKTLQIKTGIYSILEAIEDAKLTKDELSNAALVMGTSIGASHTFSEFYKNYLINNEITPYDLELSSNSTQTITGEIAKHFEINGPMCTISTACSASTNAVGRAYDMIKIGKCDVVIAGGLDIFTELAFTGFNCLQALSTSTCKPFSKNREGLMLGDSSTFFVIEDYEIAKKSNKNIYAEVISYHFFNEAYHPTSLKSDGTSVFDCMKKALDKGNLTINDIDYINAHGTATKVNDSSELKGIEILVAEGNKKEPMYVSSSKGMLGHCLGAAGAVELATIMLSMQKGFIPANAAVGEDELIEHSERISIPIKSLEKEYTYAISNSFAFGGNMSSIIIKNGTKI